MSEKNKIQQEELEKVQGLVQTIRDSEGNFFKASFISSIHSSKPSLVRWFKAGKVPTIPFLQHSITNCGPDIKNIGAVTTGRAKSFINGAF